MAEQNKSVIIISPSHSTATQLSSEATDQLYNYFNEKGYNTIYLEGSQARKLPLLLALNQTEGDRRLIIYIGHGANGDSLIGDEILNWNIRRLQLITTDQDIFNQAILSKFGENDIIITIACEAYNLGVLLVEEYGVQSFYTSSEKMWIGTGFNTPTESDQDFITLFSMIPILLEQNVSTKWALEYYKYKLRGYMNLTEDNEFREYMFQNYHYFTMIGEDVVW